MNKKLIKILERILEDDNEKNRLMKIETFDEAYEFFKNKIPDLTYNEFNESLIEMFREVDIQEENVKALDKNILESIAGGKNLGKKFTSGMLAFISTLSGISSASGSGGAYPNCSANVPESQSKVEQKYDEYTDLAEKKKNGNNNSKPDGTGSKLWQGIKNHPVLTGVATFGALIVSSALIRHAMSPIILARKVDKIKNMLIDDYIKQFTSRYGAEPKQMVFNSNALDDLKLDLIYAMASGRGDKVTFVTKYIFEMFKKGFDETDIGIGSDISDITYCIGLKNNVFSKYRSSIVCSLSLAQHKNERDEIRQFFANVIANLIKSSLDERRYDIANFILNKLDEETIQKLLVNSGEVYNYIGSRQEGMIVSFDGNTPGFSNTDAHRKRVFNDTERYIAEHRGVLMSDCSSHIVESKDDIVDTVDTSVQHKAAYGEPARLILTNGKSLQSMNAVMFRYFRGQQLKCGVLNFANFFKPGGGVVEGAGAQEECLCRITTLYDAIFKMKNDFYEANKRRRQEAKDAPSTLSWVDIGVFNRIIYTQNVRQIKEDVTVGRLNQFVDGPTFDMVTAVMPELRNTTRSGESTLNASLKEMTLDEMKRHYRLLWHRILKAFYDHKVDVIDLGAIGCGVFKNDPIEVAEAFYEVFTTWGPSGENQSFENSWAHYFKCVIHPVFTTQKTYKPYSSFKSKLEAYSDFGGQFLEIDLKDIT